MIETGTDTIRRIAAGNANPRLVKVFLTDVSELPDACRNYPLGSQQAFLMTYNNWLAKSGGDVGKSMFAAHKAMTNHAEQVRRRREQDAALQRKRDHGREAGDVADYTLDRLIRGKRPMIVVG